MISVECEFVLKLKNTRTRIDRGKQTTRVSESGDIQTERWSFWEWSERKMV